MTALAAPPTRYARSGEARIAFQGDWRRAAIIFGQPAPEGDDESEAPSARPDE